LIFDTICDATRNRQDEVRALAPHVDAIVVVGGYHSGNTRRLAQVAESTGLPVFHVETAEELDKERLILHGNRRCDRRRVHAQLDDQESGPGDRDHPQQERTATGAVDQASFQVSFSKQPGRRPGSLLPLPRKNPPFRTKA
jgi:1-aminocyclopropane-1-carboxylate deaminase/D-cysteine desulfhydrase-like pyridoxal-dependent ACC family enzyme